MGEESVTRAVASAAEAVKGRDERAARKAAPRALDSLPRSGWKVNKGATAPRLKTAPDYLIQPDFLSRQWGVPYASPFVSYYWLDPNLQAFENRARLQVTTRLPTRNVSSNDSLQERPYKIDITNVGRLPAKDVLMTFQYLVKEEVDSDIQLLPPIPIDVVVKEDTKFVTLNKSLAPQDMVEVTFKIPPKTIWVATEFGETTILNIDIDPTYKSMRDVERAMEGLKNEVKLLKEEREKRK